MPESAFGLASPRAFAGMVPRVKQTASSATSPNVTFATAPTPGSVLLLGVASIQQGQANASGGGVSAWKNIGRYTITGAQIELDFWLGKVDTTPSATVSRTFTNTGILFCVEVAAGLVGDILRTNIRRTTVGGTGEGCSSGAISLGSLAAASPLRTYPGRRFGLVAYWYATRNATGAINSTPNDPWTYDSGYLGGNPNGRLALRPYVFGTQVTITAPTGGVNNHCGIAALIA